MIRIHVLERSQFVPLPRVEVFAFFADPRNLEAITPAFLQDTLQEAGGIEANVATGYHAIEFLLWGQDLNGTGAGAGGATCTVCIGTFLATPKSYKGCGSTSTGGWGLWPKTFSCCGVALTR